MNFQRTSSTLQQFSMLHDKYAYSLKNCFQINFRMMNIEKMCNLSTFCVYAFNSLF